MHPPMHLPRFSAPFRQFRQSREFSLFKMNIPTTGGERCPQTMSGRWTHAVLDTPSTAATMRDKFYSEPTEPAKRTPRGQYSYRRPHRPADSPTKLIDQPEQAGPATFNRRDKRRQTKQENNRTPEERRSKTNIKTDQQNSNMATFPFQTVYNIPYSLEYRLPFFYYR